MNFLNIFFKEETVVGLCAFGLERQTLPAGQSDLMTNYQTFFNHKTERAYQSNFDKNILLI